MPATLEVLASGDKLTIVISNFCDILKQSTASGQKWTFDAIRPLPSGGSGSFPRPPRRLHMKSKTTVTSAVQTAERVFAVQLLNRQPARSMSSPRWAGVLPAGNTFWVAESKRAETSRPAHRQHPDRALRVMCPSPLPGLILDTALPHSIARTRDQIDWERSDVDISMRTSIAGTGGERTPVADGPSGC